MNAEIKEENAEGAEFENEEEEIDAFAEYEKAGEIAKKVGEEARKVAKPGAKLLDIAEAIENKIMDLGGKPAFPVNLSLNEIAAHYTPKPEDELVLRESDLLKVDYGVHCNGFIVDTAFSVNSDNSHAKLLEASEAALQGALSILKPGVSVSEIGKVIQTEIEKRGFKPIANLCGHSLDRFNLHAGEEIPNVERGGYALQAGDVFAIEPFATTGKGWIRQGSVCEIYSLAKLGSVRLPQSRKLLSFIENEFFTLPFARRQLEEVASELALADLIQQGFLHEYPILVEEGKGFVSQAETSVIIEENGAKILV